MFIACAVDSSTQIIISGDSDLLAVPDYEDVQIVTPRDFADSHIR